MVPHPNRSKKKQTATSSAATIRAPRARQTENPHDYPALLSGLQYSFAQSGSHLFCTDVEGLFETYLKNIPTRLRQHHNCSACRRFIETYGGLVSIDSDGQQVPAMWRQHAVSDFYRPAIEAMRARVQRANVTSVFLTKEKTWGLPKTGAWKHMAVQAPAHLVYRGIALTAGQAMAAAIENVKTVQTALREFSPFRLDVALRLLESERLANSEKFIGPVRWLRQLHDRPKGKPGHNLIWAAVAAAPEGYCHPRASVVGSLLEDIAAGYTFDVIRKRFHEKLDPLQYQRPQAAPAVGNIKAAQALVDKLGIERSLQRRFARFDELETIWLRGSQKEMRVQAPRTGVFSHLMPSVVPAGVDLPRINVTWEKFRRIVLPAAERIEVVLEAKAPLLAFTTAEHLDAPAILKWPSHVAWYCYKGGSIPSQWGVQAHAWLPVTAIAPLPTMWGDRPQPHLGEGVVLVIEGCVDLNTHQGNGLFPECLRGDLHGVRSTIEAYSRSATLGGRESASACGYDIRKGGTTPARVRVWESSAWAEYMIDRWD